MSAFIYKDRLLKRLNDRRAGAKHPLAFGAFGEIIRIIEDGEFDWAGESE